MTVLAIKNINEEDQITKIDEKWSLERQILCGLINEGTSCQKIADDTGFNRSYISRYKNGKLEQKVEEVESTLREYFKKLGRWPEINEIPAGEAYIKNISELGIIVTQDHARILGVCSKTHTQKEMSLLVGAPGTGKTKAMEAYKKSNINTYIVTCTKRMKTKTMLRKTAEALGIESYGSSGDIELRIMKAISRKPSTCLLIYDEADFLTVDSLETIRSIYDNGNAAVVLCGNEMLSEKILVYAEDKPDYARLRDRIGYYQRVTGLGELEAERFVEKINCTQEAKRMLIEIGVNRGIRQLVKAIGRLLDVTEGRLINGELVRELGQIVLSFTA